LHEVRRRVSQLPHELAAALSRLLGAALRRGVVMAEIHVVAARRPFFSPKALAAYLDISERTVRQLLADGVIPSYKIAGSRRIDPADVDAFVARCRAA
jgi:excisionase family DNA binding protein